MVSQLLSRVVILAGGMLFPAYRSYKAVRTKDVREYVKWMMYWIVFAIYSSLETFLDVFVSFWCPFYYELKILFVLYLLSPYTKGATVIYRKFIHPTLVRHEGEIDLLLDQAKTETYSTMRRLGSQTMYQARDLIATAAVKGQAQLIQQLSRSHSLGDVNEEDKRHRSRSANSDQRQSTRFERDRLQTAATYKRRGVTVQEIREEEMDLVMEYIDDTDAVDAAPAASRKTPQQQGRQSRGGSSYRTAAKQSEEEFIDQLMDEPPTEPRGRPPVFVPAASPGSNKAQTLHGGRVSSMQFPSMDRETSPSGEGHQVYDGFATVSQKGAHRITRTQSHAAAGRTTRASARAKVSSDTFKAVNAGGDEELL